MTASVTEPDGLFALIGPGGTGKSHVVLNCRSLAEHFFGSPTAVRSCAVSNTAARLIGGNTVHALFKLPSVDSRRQLSTTAIAQLRDVWTDTYCVAWDEISMAASVQVDSVHKRAEVAKCNTSQPFGDLAMLVSSDFLQLPPVESDVRHSLADIPTEAADEKKLGWEARK